MRDRQNTGYPELFTEYSLVNREYTKKNPNTVFRNLTSL